MEVVITDRLRDVSPGVHEGGVSHTGGNGDDVSPVAVVDHLERQPGLVWLDDRLCALMRRRPAQGCWIGVARGQCTGGALDFGTHFVAPPGQFGHCGWGDAWGGQLMLQAEHAQFQREPAVGQCVESSRLCGRPRMLWCPRLELPELDIQVQAFSRYVRLGRAGQDGGDVVVAPGRQGELLECFRGGQEISW
ncbi:hypothetical protein ACW9HE_13030 [Nocardia gipuzkoensis]|uniref:hypothetical protein n=1 Tax=Nocardia abscessus TaxID=120957 RepID=UPI002459009F|nr:hypothetical protein [Nocardia abscessus]